MKRYLLLIAVFCLCITSVAGVDIETRVAALEQWKDDAENRLSLLEQWKTTIENTINTIKAWLGFSQYPDVCVRIDNCGVPLPVTCYSDSECGTDSYVGDEYCNNDNVYQDYRTYTCNNPGTAESYCSHEDTPIMKVGCNNGCAAGECLPPAPGEVIFRTNVPNNQWDDCGPVDCWIALDSDQDGDLDAAGFAAKYAWRYCDEHYRTTYPVVAETPDGFDVISSDMERFYICDTDSGRRITFSTAVEPTNPELSASPTEPYSANNQEVYGVGYGPGGLPPGEEPDPVKVSGTVESGMDV